MVCPNCDCIMESMGSGDECCPKCGFILYSESEDDFLARIANKGMGMTFTDYQYAIRRKGTNQYHCGGSTLVFGEDLRAAFYSTSAPANTLINRNRQNWESGRRHWGVHDPATLEVVRFRVEYIEDPV